VLKTILRSPNCSYVRGLINPSEFNEIKFKDLLKTYQSDIDVNKITPMSEFIIWHKKKKKISNTIEALKNCNENIGIPNYLHNYNHYF
jgi:hypothetical protein